MTIGVQRRELDRAYAVLGLPPGSSADQVKRTYRRLARETHPDACGDRRREARFIAVHAAYEVAARAAIASASSSAGGYGPSRPQTGLIVSVLA
jgi:DnaJ-domain-containing protein 1